MLAKTWLVKLPIGIPIKALSLSLRKAADYFADETQRFGVFYPAEDGTKENVVIHAVEKLPDICPPHVSLRVLLQKLLSALDAGQKAFSGAARPSIIDECFIKNWHQIIVNQAVNHSVSDGGAGNLTALVVADGEFFVRTMAVSVVIQVFKKLKEIFFKVKLKLMQFRCGPFAFTESKPALPTIF